MDVFKECKISVIAFLAKSENDGPEAISECMI